MTIERYQCLGPYIRIKVPTQEIVNTKNICSNPTCKKHTKKSDLKEPFCPLCGTKVEAFSYSHFSTVKRPPIEIENMSLSPDSVTLLDEVIDYLEKEKDDLFHQIIESGDSKRELDFDDLAEKYKNHVYLKLLRIRYNGDMERVADDLRFMENKNNIPPQQDTAVQNQVRITSSGVSVESYNRDLVRQELRKLSNQNQEAVVTERSGKTTSRN